MPSHHDATSEPSATHERAVLRQDNGELQEDVMAKETLDTADEQADAADEADEADEESFPASDPPSTWAGESGEAVRSGQGGGAGDGGARDDRRHGNVVQRVVERASVEHVPERDDPDDPVPGSLPRH